MNLLKKIVLFACVIPFGICHAQFPDNDVDIEQSPINGISLVSMNKFFSDAELEPICDIHANWVSVIPFAFLPALNDPHLVFDGEWQWLGERIAGTNEAVKLLHNTSISVMIKPQIWVGQGEFTGKISMISEADWLTFEVAYADYILKFAELAEKERVELFCIGTEMQEVIKQRPLFLTNLIDSIKTVYSGKLTYAENWDSYTEVNFWNQVDYIGIDAYFPIASGDNPSEKMLRSGWERREIEIKAYAEKQNKQVLFTEYGYRSIASCAEAPWDYSQKSKISEHAQCKALNALYEVMWDKPYFAGGFLWKWYPDHVNSGGHKSDCFTVQNKKAEEVVRRRYHQSINGK